MDLLAFFAYLEKKNSSVASKKSYLKINNYQNQIQYILHQIDNMYYIAFIQHFYYNYFLFVYIFFHFVVQKKLEIKTKNIHELLKIYKKEKLPIQISKNNASFSSFMNMHTYTQIEFQWKNKVLLSPTHKIQQGYKYACNLFQINSPELDKNTSKPIEQCTASCIIYK